MSLAQSTKKHDAGRIGGAWNCPNTVEVACQLQLPNSKLSMFKIHGTYATPPANVQTLASALFTSISSAWGTNVAALCPPGTIFQAVYARDMANTGNPIFTGTGTAVPGTSASIAMPVNAAIVLTEQTQFRGRGLKGRIYMAGFATNADGGGGLITTAAQTALNAFGTALMNALTAQSLTAAVAQAPRQAYLGVTGTSHAARGTPGNGTHVGVSSIVCRDLMWDTQRRRVQL